MLPGKFSSLFPGYNFDSLNDERESSLVIKTVLAYGEWEDILWLFRRYGKERIRAVFLRDYYGLRVLPEPTRRLWSMVFLGGTLPPLEEGIDRWRCRRRIPNK